MLKVTKNCERWCLAALSCGAYSTVITCMFFRKVTLPNLFALVQTLWGYVGVPKTGDAVAPPLDLGNVAGPLEKRRLPNWVSTLNLFSIQCYYCLITQHSVKISHAEEQLCKAYDIHTITSVLLSFTLVQRLHLILLK